MRGRNGGGARRSRPRRGSRPRRHGPADVPLVEIEVPVDGGTHWVREVTARWPVRLRFRVCRPLASQPRTMLQVVEMTGAPADLGEIERFLRERTDVDALTVLAQSPSRRYLRVVSPMPEPCGRVFDAGAVCASCRFLPSPEGRTGHRWGLVVPRSPAALRALARPATRGPSPESSILRMRRFVPPRTLTPRQAAAIETAYRLGFYDFPRRTNLIEIARILRVSRATASEHLRRAEAKMLEPELSSA